jgi:UDP-glucose 4-epimerase
VTAWSGLSGENVLVTGGAGFIGGNLVAALTAAGANVRVVDKNPGKNPHGTTLVGDLRDPAVRDAAITPDLAGVMHLAAETSVLGSLERPHLVHEVNVEVTAGLLELARQRGVTRFIMASTNAVAGDVGDRIITEELPLRPLTPYGATKAAAEMLLSGYAGGYGLATCALRLSNVYGPGMGHKDSLVPRIMRAVRSGRPLQVYGSGGQSRDFVHVDDVVASFLAAWRTGYVGNVIIGRGTSISVLDMVAAAERATGHTVPVEHIDAKPGEMPAVRVSIERAREVLGYQPAVGLSDGLKTVWDEFR